MPPNQSLEPIPPALGARGKAITLGEGAVVVVEKWSLQKFLQLTDYVFSAFGGDAVRLNDLLKGSEPGQVAGSFVTRLGSKLPGFIELSVRAEDREKVKDLLAEDALALLNAILDLNATEAFLKKVSELIDRFQSVWGRVKALTPSKPPLGSSARTG